MKKFIRTAIVVILTIVAILSLILMCAERPDGSISLTWSLGWLVALVASAKILDKMGCFKKEDAK